MKININAISPPILNDNSIRVILKTQREYKINIGHQAKGKLFFRFFCQSKKTETIGLYEKYIDGLLMRKNDDFFIRI